MLELEGGVGELVGIGVDVGDLVKVTPIVKTTDR